MTGWMTSISDSITSVALLTPKIAFAISPVGVSLELRVRASDSLVKLDAHTCRDIGIEPGSLTWLQ